MKATILLSVIAWALMLMAFLSASNERDKLKKQMHDYQVEINDGYRYTLYDEDRVVAHIDTAAVPFLDNIIFKDNE